MQYLEGHTLTWQKQILVSPHIFAGTDTSNGMKIQNFIFKSMISPHSVHNVVSGGISPFSGLQLSLEHVRI